jgi:hypothetical protein
MTSEQINRAIADITDRGSDFFNDLNAMAEAEGFLTEDDLPHYHARLVEAVTGYRILDWASRAISATAPQRARAFLRTIGKWEGE